MKTLTGGHFVYANGQPVANGKITFQLTTASTATAGGQVSANIISFPLDSAGNIVTGAQIVANDEITPAGSSYVINVYDSKGALVYGSQPFVISGTSPIDLGAVVPITAEMDLVGQSPAAFTLGLYNGGFTFSDGTPVSNGTIVFQLPVDEDLLSGGHVSHLPISYPLDANGNIVAGSQLYANDGFTDSDSTYLVTVYDNKGNKISGPSDYYIDTTNNRYRILDLSLMTQNDPETSNYPQVPAGVYVRMGGSQAANQPTVVMTPVRSTVQVSSTQQLNAEVAGTGTQSQGLTWSVNGVVGGNAVFGTVTQSGLYTAPTSPGTYTVTAALQVNPAIKATSTITVQTAPVSVGVAITPGVATISAGYSLPFTASVSGTSNTGVTWSVNGIPGGSNTGSGGSSSTGQGGTATNGTITLNVTNVTISGNNVTVTANATDTTNGVVSFQIYVDGAATPVVSLGSSNNPNPGPWSPTITLSNGTHTLACKAWNSISGDGTSGVGTVLVFIQVTVGTTVTGSVAPSTNPDLGSITQQGLYTAPATLGAVTITATSQANPAVSASAAVTVISGVAIDLYPANTNVLTSGTRQLTALVTGSADTSVSWTVDGIPNGNGTVGTISSTGLYSAPGSGGTHTIVATSKADNTVSATATMVVAAAGAVNIQISPTSATLVGGQSTTFVASVIGNANTNVTWEVDGVVGGNNTSGRISTTGVYIAPNVTGTHTITAISQADNTKTTSATVSVTATGTSGGGTGNNAGGGNNTGGSGGGTAGNVSGLVSQLMGHNTSASPNYDQNHFTFNFGNFTCDTTNSATFPPTANCGFIIDPTLTDMSMNPITPAHVSNVSVKTLIPSRADLKWFEHWTPWFINGGGGGHVDIGLTNNSASWVQARVTDAVNRGFDGCIIDWDQLSSTGIDGVTQKLKAYLAANPTVPYKYIIMIDHRAYGSTAELISLLQYCQQQYFSDPHYEYEGSLPVVMFFDSVGGVDYQSAKSTVPGYWMFQGPGAIGNSSIASDGCFDWTHDNTNGGVNASDPYNTTDVKWFYQTVAGTGAKCVGSMSGGFDGTLTQDVAWSLGKYLPRDGGKCVVEWSKAINQVIPAEVTRMQWCTCNDWEEGTQMESGIENQCTVTASISGTTLNWSVSFLPTPQGGDETTIHHYEIWATPDGTNAILVGTVAQGVHTFNLSTATGLVNGSSYTIYVKAVGMPCIRDHMSAGIAYGVSGVPSPPSSTIPASKHVVIVVEENTNRSSVVGNGNAPNLNSFMNAHANVTQFYANYHPSIGNYFEMLMGQAPTQDDTNTTIWNVDSICRRMMAAGVSFKTYAESLPAPGSLSGDNPPYYRRHNPMTFISDVANNTTVAQSAIVPFTQFATDLAAGNLPQFSFIVPNGNDDAHDGTLTQADTWLQTNVITPLFANSAFQNGGDGVLIVLFDESGNDNTNGGGLVYCALGGPNVKTSFTQTSGNVYNFDNLLRTVCDALRLPNPPGAAATATPMSEFFVGN